MDVQSRNSLYGGIHVGLGYRAYAFHTNVPSGEILPNWDRHSRWITSVGCNDCYL
jgi:hypothetical protein